jgi:hypothetical protein
VALPPALFCLYPTNGSLIITQEKSRQPANANPGFLSQWMESRFAFACLSFSAARQQARFPTDFILTELP